MFSTDCVCRKWVYSPKPIPVPSLIPIPNPILYFLPFIIIQLPFIKNNTCIMLVICIYALLYYMTSIYSGINTILGKH